MCNNTQYHSCDSANYFGLFLWLITTQNLSVVHLATWILPPFWLFFISNILDKPEHQDEGDSNFWTDRCSRALQGWMDCKGPHPASHPEVQETTGAGRRLPRSNPPC
ncbi:hypothetical protein XENOCAPTIV_026065 [Xenoophorus captivus]|uniref:Uncharacterized protein n=1 Tax=Xenoophorus captivus TaxID=1517983 RepID=A0ABV0QWM0_9TELE